MTIVINLVFYILTGYIGSFIGISITGFFFFYTLLICYISFVSYIAYREIKTNTYHFFTPKRSLNQDNIKSGNFSLIKYIKDLIPINGCLLVIFIFLICIMALIRVSPFGGTDPWLHIFNSRIITDLNYIPFENYHGTLGLNIFEAVISFFSGVNHILIPRYFPFYTFFLSSLIFYNISKRIFRNRNLAIFCVFILEFSSLGFSIMMFQYWPSGLSLIMYLTIFFLLYVRLQNLIQFDRPTKKKILSDILLTYTLITLIFISTVVTHTFTSAIFLLSFLWLYLIYFLRDRKRGIDFLFLCVLLGVFIILNFMGIGSDQLAFFIPLNLPWYFLLTIGIAGVIAGAFVFWKLSKSIVFTKGRYKSTITGKTNTFYKKFEDNIIIPLIFSCIILITIFMLIINIIWLNFETINILNVSEILLFSAFSIWGLILFQKKPRGKPIFIWGIGFVIILLVGFILNILVVDIMVWDRILYLIPPIIVIGFVSYIYKLIKLNSIQSLRMKLVILFIIIFSLFTTNFYQSVSFEVFILKKREISTIQWYTNNTSRQNVILTEFGWSYVFNYYDYPFNNKNEASLYNESIYILTAEIDLFPPGNHINESGVNILKEIKDEYNTDVYIIFDGDYVIGKGFELFGSLTPEETEEYYNLDYLNKICSSKPENGD
ncbi:MAG: hypothetical protein ACFFDN_49560, partial [Candidatus Hodarchaeota archaeon]